jgi:hypothetical protein
LAGTVKLPGTYLGQSGLPVLAVSIVKVLVTGFPAVCDPDEEAFVLFEEHAFNATPNKANMVATKRALKIVNLEVFFPVFGPGFS